MYLPRLKRTHCSFSLAFLLVVSTTGLTAGAAERRDIQTVGIPFTGSMGVRRTTADILFEEQRHAGDPLPPPILHNEHEWERVGLRSNSASPRVASIPQMPTDQLTYRPMDKGRFRIQSPQAIGANFTAATLAGTNPTNSFPPDCDGAVGPTQYVVAVNGRIASFNKTTGLADGIMSFSTDNFFNTVRNASGTSDPMVRYDRLSGRWFITIINVSTPNRYLIGVSDAASNGVITLGTVWTYFFFVPATLSPPIGNCLADYPSLGIDANALYMGADEFCPSFTQTDGFVIRKSSILGAGPIVVTVFRNLMSSGTGFVGPWAPRGVDNYDPASNEGYFIGVDGASYGLLQLRRVSDPGGTPAISGNVSITVPITDNPLKVPHLGNTNPLGGTTGNVDALDDRLFQVHMRNQQLWTSHNIAVDNTGVVNVTPASNTRDGSRWYQIDVPVGAGAPTIVQSGIVFTATPGNLTTERHYFVPSINVTGQGHAAMGFSTSGSAERINSATVGRLAGDPLGTMQTPVLLTASSTAYNPAGDPGSTTRLARRWGDYSITSVDPLDDMSVWTVQMFCDATNSYGVRVAKLLAPPPATPDALADIAAGYPTVNVTLTGLASLGSGFFDPGPNLAGVPAYSHLSAVISNGTATGTPPTVVSATYVNPTTVNLVLNASSATPNVGAEKYTITVTNPDGQTSSAAVVHVVAPTTYTISASAGAGGTISPSGAVSVLSGLDQVFSIAANPCFVIGDVQVDGSSVGAVSSYTFTNVTADHTIEASFTALGPYTIVASAGPNGSITPSGNVSVACGATQSFAIAAAPCYHIAGVVVDGGSVGAVAGYTFTNVTMDHSIAASFAINPDVGPVTGLSASQVKAGNDASGRTKITLTYTAPGTATSVEVWRKGFGGYPLYSPGGAPPLPGSYPPAGWTLTGVTASGQADQPSSRDYWYYVAYAKDACATVSTVSNRTGGTLGYHLGDVSDGLTPGQGDNTVNAADASLLGAYYGMSGAGLTGVEYLDVGPTTDLSTDGRPTVDSALDFEDLVMFSLNYTPQVSLAKSGPVAAFVGPNSVEMKTPYVVTSGAVFDVPIELSAGGNLHAASVALGWDPAVVAPLDVKAGEMVLAQGGVMLSPGPGRADLALLGAGRGLAGSGVMATMRFRALATGDPRFTFDRVMGRDAANKPVSLNARNPYAYEGLVTATDLLPVIPNPSRGTSIVQWSLATPGPVDLSIFSVDGRRVKTLVHGVQEVGRYHFTWNGTNDHGLVAKSGLYFVQLDAAGAKKTRLVTVIR